MGAVPVRAYCGPIHYRSHVQGVVAAHEEFLCNHSSIKGIGHRSACRPAHRGPREGGTWGPQWMWWETFLLKKRVLFFSSSVSQSKIVSLCHYPLNVGRFGSLENIRQ